MKLTELYQFTDQDPAWDVVLLEAFNVLRNFAPELEDPTSPEHKAFKRITTPGGQFTKDDAALLTNLGVAVNRRAMAKYPSDDALDQAVRQAGERLRQEAVHFWHWFEQQPNVKIP